MFKTFVNDAELQSLGALPYRFATNHFWFDRKEGKYDESKVSEARIRRFFPNENKLCVMNLESFVLNDETRTFVKEQIQLATDTIRDINPNIRIGWYRIIPQRNYWAPILRDARREERLREWRNENRQNIRHFGHMFDFINPSLYSFYPNDPAHTYEKWEEYADANLRECIYARKQTYAWVWPKYHNSDVPLPEKMWRQQLRYLRDHEHCDGVMIFTSGVSHDWKTAVKEELL